MKVVPPSSVAVPHIAGDPQSGTPASLPGSTSNPVSTSLPVSISNPVPTSLPVAVSSDSHKNQPLPPSRTPTPGSPSLDGPRNSSPGPGGSGKTQTVFIHKLYDMLEDPSLSHLIWWAPSEDSFCLYPGEEFSNVLAQYFKHTNIASFIRQLNMYGFHKVNDNFSADEKPASPAPATSGTKWEFRHSANQFRKGDKVSLRLIKRKSSKVMNSHKEIVSLKSLPPTSNPIEDKDNSRLQQQYHRSVYQQLWDQLEDANSPSPKPTPTAMYASSVLAHPPYPLFQLALNGMPISPGSPPYPEHPSQTSYVHAAPLLQPPLQPQLRQLSAVTVDLSINLKLVEMANSINSLRTSYLELLGRFDSLAGLYQKSQADILQLTEICEKLEERPDDAECVKKEPVDRNKSRTPVGRGTTPSHEGMSPMTVKPTSKIADLRAFKLQLLSRMGHPTRVAPSPAPHSQNYHLNEVSLAVSRAPSNIVPQHYPLNPNYTLYNNHEPVFRLMKMSNDDLLSQPGATRHFSVLMDPLQPGPGRSGHAEEARSFSPLSHLHKDAKHPEGTYVQQYQSRAQHPAYYQPHILHEVPNQQRTASLPILEEALPTGNPQHRHSLNTVPETLNAPENVLPPVMRSQSPGGASFPIGLVTSAPITPAVRELPHIQVPKAISPAMSEGQQRNQLPSVLELDKSIKNSTTGRVYDLLLDSDDDDRLKKRRLEA